MDKELVISSSFTSAQVVIVDEHAFWEAYKTMPFADFSKRFLEPAMYQLANRLAAQNALSN